LRPPTSVQVRPQEPDCAPARADFSAGEINAALECLLSTYVTMGPKVKKFEETFVTTFGWTDGVMNNSGSSAICWPWRRLPTPRPRRAEARRRGDRAGALLVDHGVAGDSVRLVPVIADIDPATFNIDPNEIEKAIGPRRVP